MIGLELHVQLDTREKLFCSCPTTMDGNVLGTVSRYLRASPGETGEVDKAAIYESKKARKFTYQISNSCLVELDEEPPHEPNKDALRIALQIAKLLHCKIQPEIYFMRKIVVDGSNTTGFQRTALVARNGYVKTSWGKVKIETVMLEEDACSKVDDTTFNLSRLGIPLVELTTEPGAETPEQARELAERIGYVIRSVRTKRQLGSIRQDVNVSIPGGARVEIKGVQSLTAVEKCVELEQERQLNLLSLRPRIATLKISSIKDVSTAFVNTSSFLKPP
ncbi:Glu-tRNA(Gln) amidotransferase GatDE subunit E, partial [Nanoarchaeota archaeon]